MILKVTWSREKMAMIFFQVKLHVHHNNQIAYLKVAELPHNNV